MDEFCKTSSPRKRPNLKIESVSRIRKDIKQLSRPRFHAVTLRQTSYGTFVDILHRHTSRDVRMTTKMVELQKTLSFDEHILPHLLREREKYSGRLAEEGYGI